jgi:Type II CAAX prenyl endopeptidase Rce1-like
MMVNWLRHSLALMLAAFLVLPALAPSINLAPVSPAQNLLSMSWRVAQLGLLSLLILAIHPDLKQCFWQRPQWRVVGLLLGILLAINWLLSSLLPRAFSVLEPLTLALKQRSDYPILFTLILWLSAYQEELLYRVLPSSLMGKVSHRYGLLWQTLFALAHLHMGISGFVASLILGLILWHAKMLGATLHTLVIAHTLYNLVLVLLT